MTFRNVALAAVIFFVFAFGSFTLLRKRRTVGERTMALLLFAVGSVILTLWVLGPLNLLMGEAATSWIIALVFAGPLVIARH